MDLWVIMKVAEAGIITSGTVRHQSYLILLKHLELKGLAQVWLLFISTHYGFTFSGSY